MKKIDPELKKQNKYNYDQNYIKNNTIRKIIQFNKNTEADLIEFINSIDNFSGYIKNFLYSEMEKQKSSKQKK